MATYSEHDQRQLDISSGRQMDQEAEIMGLRDDAAEAERVGGPSDWFNKTGAWEREASCQQGEPCGNPDNCPDPVGCGFILESTFVRLSLDEFESIMKNQWRMCEMIGMARAFLRMGDKERALAALGAK